MIGKFIEFITSLALILFAIYVAVMLLIITSVGLFLAARFLVGLL